MKSYIYSTLALAVQGLDLELHSSALTTQTPPPGLTGIQHYTSQSECPVSPLDAITYVFDQETCTCWFQTSGGVAAGTLQLSPGGNIDWENYAQYVNPALEPPFTYLTQTPSQTTAIINHFHGLGPDCVAGTADDTENQCPKGYYWLPDICECALYNAEETAGDSPCDSPDDWCIFSGYDADGTAQCECVTFDEMGALLTDECEDVNECEKPGWEFDPDLCSCVNKNECDNFLCQAGYEKNPYDRCECIPDLLA